MIKNKTYLITPSLLNSWGYIYNCIDNVREAQSDTMCLEDKQAKRQKEAYESFLKTLNREHIEANKYMLEGIKFEQDCYDGKTCFSDTIKGGAYQIVGMKHVEVDGIKFLMYGRLDVLKSGIVYDIKRVARYELPKYAKSYQHRFYLDLFPRAYKFEYLIYDGYNEHHEIYYREDTEPTVNVISRFIHWLKEHDLLDIYFDKWESKH